MTTIKDNIDELCGVVGGWVGFVGIVAAVVVPRGFVTGGF